jgi:hypothetical protein
MLSLKILLYSMTTLEQWLSWSAYCTVICLPTVVILYDDMWFSIIQGVLKRMPGFETPATQEWKKRYINFCSVTVNSKHFSPSTSCAACIPSVVNGQHFRLHVLRDQYDIYCAAESTDCVVIWKNLNSLFEFRCEHGVRPPGDKSIRRL